MLNPNRIAVVQSGVRDGAQSAKPLRGRTLAPAEAGEGPPPPKKKNKIFFFFPPPPLFLQKQKQKTKTGEKKEEERERLVCPRQRSSVRPRKRFRRLVPPYGPPIGSHSDAVGVQQ